MKGWPIVLFVGIAALIAWGRGPLLGSTVGANEVAVTPAQAPLQEFIPLPFPGGERDGQGRAPSQDQQECEPTVLFYHQGRLYQLQPGPNGQPGLPGSPPEFFYLRPYNPQIPGVPAPHQAPTTPNFRPVVPRF